MKIARKQTSGHLVCTSQWRQRLFVTIWNAIYREHSLSDLTTSAGKSFAQVGWASFFFAGVLYNVHYCTLGCSVRLLLHFVPRQCIMLHERSTVAVSCIWTAFTRTALQGHFIYCIQMSIKAGIPTLTVLLCEHEMRDNQSTSSCLLHQPLPLRAGALDNPLSTKVSMPILRLCCTLLSRDGTVLHT